uniref:MULE transposase domain-containing protein n=1 Tax=Ditylenchus dipsaci TaxID=166011 RepID=A0A915EMC0_9BILA
MKVLKAAVRLTYDVDGLIKFAFDELNPFPSKAFLKQPQKMLNIANFSSSSDKVCDLPIESITFSEFVQGCGYVCAGNQKRGKLSMISFHKEATNLNTLEIEVCGFSDANRKYFGTCIALSSNEDIWGYEQFFQIVAKDRYVPEILMGDGDQAILTAAENIWPRIKRGMCKAHMKMNLRKKLDKSFKRENPVAGKQISSDVRLLEQASSTKEFLIASAFFQQEWSRRYVGQLEALKHNGVNFESVDCQTGRAVMVMCEKRMLVYPPDAISMNLAQKRKSGRPKLAGPALSMN